VKPFEDLTEAERDREVLRALVQQAKAGDHRARRCLGELLGIPIGRRVPSLDELLASVPRD
jgi:hypothetical protein